MELIEIIEKVKALLSDIQGDSVEDDDLLERAYDLCDNALIDYKVNKALREVENVQ